MNVITVPVSFNLAAITTLTVPAIALPSKETRSTVATDNPRRVPAIALPAKETSKASTMSANPNLFAILIL
ncbi:hypothetical protein FACS1894216_17290 [Synergistales bacterium]|nr:hypothetical protein FACS1894216_17290 [Synergistales bacterium]